MTRDASIVDLLRRRAERDPTRRAFCFLEDDGDGPTLAFGELDRRARAIACLVAERTRPGMRVVLLYEPSLDFVAGFYGCLYAGTVAVPAYPPDPRRLARTLPRLRAIFDNAGATMVLTTARLREAVALLFPTEPWLEAMQWIATDEAATADLAEGWRHPGVGADTLALLQYTSGSTRTPRGVMLTHGNVLANSALIKRAFGNSRHTRGVLWAPPYHDLGLIGGILQPVFVGTAGLLMSPLSFLRKPVRWLQAISRHRATTSGGPNFAYDLCVDRTTPEERAQLDLSCWRVAFNGAEPIRARTLDRFVETFAPHGFDRRAFYPCYGLAEATLIATGGRIDAAPAVASVCSRALEQGVVRHVAREVSGARILVGSGRALAGNTVRIVDPETRTPCPAGTVGEIWVSGPSVGLGYWGAPESRASTFAVRLAGGGEQRFLRTGDLGFVHAGELFVTGRRHDVIIVRGRNHYPQDLEETAELAHPALRPGCGAAFSAPADGNEEVVLASEIDAREPGDLAAVVDAVRRGILLEHGLALDAVLLLDARSVPKTSSGKIQRHACREAYVRGELSVVAAWRRDDAGAAAPRVARAR
ncbi:fatty acyl-AMP ligase [Candidatus Binatia bacterium]|jgi:acyl-CoA synthetase (AMP-forming)/AMP-acid ligase II|nr:fatty acyl-AMP ligase [Candidatus Binatia bacterium]